MIFKRIHEEVFELGLNLIIEFSEAREPSI